MPVELLVIIINLAILLVAYLFVHPLTAGANINLLLLSDTGASVTSLLVCGSLFWGSGVEFNLIFFTANWFWFAMLSFFIMELPFIRWYMTKHNIELP